MKKQDRVERNASPATFRTQPKKKPLIPCEITGAIRPEPCKLGFYGLFSRKEKTIRANLAGPSDEIQFTAWELVAEIVWMLSRHERFFRDKIIPGLDCVARQADALELIAIASSLKDVVNRDLKECHAIRFEFPGIAGSRCFDSQELLDLFANGLFTAMGVISKQLIPTLPADEALRVAELLCAIEAVMTESEFGTEINEVEHRTIYDPTTVQKQAWELRRKFFSVDCEDAVKGGAR